ncbi:MAG: lamin tail domain-containing protein [Alphaproteobacteria bacterium]|nr:lamin tail domain-containing protein [Alphaproteobacteria bacterium]
MPRWIPWLLPLSLGCKADPRLDLVLNEFMASNQETIPNEEGSYADWVELYNPADEDVSVAGLYMTDDLNEPTLHALGDIVVPAGGHLLLWADEEPQISAWHLSFKLSKDGERLALVYVDDDGNPSVIDGVEFGPQEPDVSWGRVPDGGAWQTLSVPSPGQENR